MVIANLIVPFGLAGLFIYFLFSPRRGLLKKLQQELRDRLFLYPNYDIPKNSIWLHCASVGEVNSMTNLIPKLVEFYNRPVLITTNTWAGKVTALKKDGVDAAVLLPFDFFPLSLLFVLRVKPKRMFVIEGELWPNTIMAAAACGVQISIINGRMSPKSAKRYRLIRSLYSLLMSKMTFAALQNEDIKARYISLGLKVQNAYAPGNVKYDSLNQNPSKTEDVRKIIDHLNWQGKPLLVCGSTHPAEEALIMSCAEEFAQNNIRVVMAPRHLERKEAIIETLQKKNIKFALLSQCKNAPGDAALLFADAMGWLTSFYACADLSFVGGTIAPKGGHNLLEPAILGAPVLFGPSVYNTSDTAAELLRRGGAIEINENNFKETVIKLASDKTRLAAMSVSAKEAALSFQGATDKIMELVEKYER